MIHILEWQETTNLTRGTVLPVRLIAPKANNKVEEGTDIYMFVPSF